jgi:hypothetical protein
MTSVLVPDFVEFSVADRVWNRAALAKGGAAPRDGDRALASMVLAHSLAMNGGVLHAVESLTTHEPDEFIRARDGYVFFGFEAIAKLLDSAKAVLDSGADLEEAELRLDAAYGSAIPSDEQIVTAFERHFAVHPGLYAPLVLE